MRLSLAPRLFLLTILTPVALAQGGDVLPPRCTTDQPAPGRVDGVAVDDAPRDSGIASITLSGRAVNLVLTVDGYGPGDPIPGDSVVTWHVGRRDSMRTGVGDVIIRDVAGNATFCFVALSPESDCNGNGVADSLDLASFTSYDWDGNGRPDECDQLGIMYCSPQNSNSTGQPGFLMLTGSNLVADNDVTLTAFNLPLQSFGFFAYSRTSDFIPASFATSSGNLCLGSPRGAALDDVQRTGLSGTMSLGLDLNAGLPYPSEPGGSLTVLPGMTVYFQAWFRDSFALTRRSNLTDAVEVFFQ